MTLLLIKIAILHLSALAVPGPDFFFVSQVAVSRSRWEGFKAALGITAGVVLWAILALLGLHILLEKIPQLRLVIMLLGALYLIYMGYQLLKNAYTKWHQKKNSVSIVISPHYQQLFLKGLLTNLANPKAIIYFASIFSLIVAGGITQSGKIAILGIVTIETLIWFILVAFIFSQPLLRRGYQKATIWIDGGTGILFIGFALRILYLLFFNS